MSITMSEGEKKTVFSRRQRRKSSLFRKAMSRHKEVLEIYLLDPAIPSIIRTIGLDEIKYLSWEDYTGVIEQLIMEPNA